MNCFIECTTFSSNKINFLPFEVFSYKKVFGFEEDKKMESYLNLVKTKSPS